MVGWCREYGTTGLTGVLVALWLSVVCRGVDSLPADVLEDDWRWLYGCGVCVLAGMALLVFFVPGRLKECLPFVTSWILVVYGGIEAVWGIRQVYGFTFSNHALYALTGSFYNPGPYSGYLAMAFPVCLYEWLKRKDGRKTLLYYVALAGMLLVLCVLPAGMSRSAWAAAGVSSAYVCSMCYEAEIKEYVRRHRRKALGLVVVFSLLGAMAAGGIYLMKKDSADGRLFIWKIAARTVTGHPWTGVGWGSVAAAYGQEQEAYFAVGDYTLAEELVAGTPEYVFNEYLQVAVAWGIPTLCVGLLILGSCWMAGHRQRLYGLCGALLALAVFAFSSYPLQFPAFVSTLSALALACVIQRLPLEKSGFRLGFAVLWCVGCVSCYHAFRQKSRAVAACRQWNRSRMLYQSGAYRQAAESYADIREEMGTNARFLFEYGHALHKLHESEASNKVLEEALKVSGDPMILNVMGKNEQEMGHYDRAEHYFVRAVHRLPGRIYPYYLLAHLYADPAFYQRGKLEQMVRTVLEKEPKVQSTAIRQMRQKVRELLEAVPKPEAGEEENRPR